MRRTMWIALPLTVSAGLVLGPNAASAQENPNPYARPNGSWITMGGTVQDLTPSSFTLDYGRGMIEVDMGESDQSVQSGMLQEGDTVDVTGRVDDNFLENETIAAASVYDARFNKYIYTTGLEDEYKPWASVRITQPNTTIFRGEVTQVGENEFTIDRGPRQVTVWVGDLESNPLEGAGPGRIHVGDYVSVTAAIDHDLFDHRVLEALDVKELYHD